MLNNCYIYVEGVCWSYAGSLVVDLDSVSCFEFRVVVVVNFLEMSMTPLTTIILILTLENIEGNDSFGEK